MKVQQTTHWLVIALLALTLTPRAHARITFQQTIAVGGTELVILRGDNEQELLERCAVLYGRLPWILADAKMVSSDVQVRTKGDETTIYVKNQLLITITSQDANSNQNTVSHQANLWREHLSKALLLVRVLG